jgi:hypothetical protein
MSRARQLPASIRSSLNNPRAAAPDSFQRLHDPRRTTLALGSPLSTLLSSQSLVGLFRLPDDHPAVRPTQHLDSALRHNQPTHVKCKGVVNLQKKVVDQRNLRRTFPTYDVHLSVMDEVHLVQPRVGMPQGDGNHALLTS